MSNAFTLSFRPEISFTTEGNRLTLQFAPHSLTLDCPHPGLRSALEHLKHSALTAAQLTAMVVEADGVEDGLNFEAELQKLINLGWICHSVLPLATAIAIAKDYQLVSSVFDGQQPLTLSRFAFLRQENKQFVLESPLSCDRNEVEEPERCLVGKLNIPGAYQLLTGQLLPNIQASAVVLPQIILPAIPDSSESAVISASQPLNEVYNSAATQLVTASATIADIPPASLSPSNITSSAVSSKVYALGTLGYDFGSEARRDTFKQGMSAVSLDGVLIPANPYDARQMVDYLELSPSEGKSLIWTLNQELTPIYYDLRNLGHLDRDRALNFAATNAFQAASTFESAINSGMGLDSIEIEKSPFCRLNSNCWDVMLKFFDSENSRRAKKVYRFTIDVANLMPVTLGTVRSWSVPR